uniref:Uncharacterized protein n=1 Tax=Esox lucius TaxID=8010 RepID=A0A3P8YPU7_ESOLU
MFKLCLRRVLRPTVSTRALAESFTVEKTVNVFHVRRCLLGTHVRNEPREPLNSPQRAKEFIYSLHAKERTCLLRELQSFESMAIAQDGPLQLSTEGETNNLSSQHCCCLLCQCF